MAQAPRTQQLVIGGYTADGGGNAVGLTSVGVRFGPGVEPEVAVLDSLPLPSPTYLVAHPELPWLFAVQETSPASVSSLRRDEDGRLTLLSTRQTGGDAACHLALSPDHRLLLVADYGSGSVASFAVLPDGTLSERLDRRQLVGSGPDPDRQEGPHAHQVVWDGPELLVSDLGSDRVHRFRVGGDGGFSDAGPAVVLPPGSGPRHLVVVGDLLAVVGELSARVWLFRRDGAGWRPVDDAASSEAGFDGPVYPSALRLDGDRLHVANRGPGTLTTLDLDRGAGTLRRRGEVGCGGSWPRDVAVGPGELWVANQTDDLVTVLDAQDPGGEPVLTLPTPSPACVLLLPEASG